MRSITSLIVIAFFADSHSEDPQNSMDLVDKLLDRTSTKLPLHHSGLEETMLGKPCHLGMAPHATSSLAMVLQFRRERVKNGHRQDDGRTRYWHSSLTSSVTARAVQGPEPETGGESSNEREPADGPGVNVPRNVLGGELSCCCSDVRGTGIGTGFYRDGYCSTGVDDAGRHTVCIEATEDFLAFSRVVGNDLSRPIPQYLFPGVTPGDRWCLCALRWVQAYQAGMAPKLYLKSTHEKTLQYVDLETLMRFAIDADDAKAEIGRLDDMRSTLERSMLNSTGI